MITFKLIADGTPMTLTYFINEKESPLEILLAGINWTDKIIVNEARLTSEDIIFIEDNFTNFPIRKHVSKLIYRGDLARFLFDNLGD